MSLHPRHATFAGAAGNRLEGDVYGTGPKVALFLHGGGQTRHAWRTAARRLAERGFTAVAVDQRGHGDSAWVETGAYDFADYAADAAALAAQVEERFGARPAAVGASLGGLASLLALGRAPVFSALVLVDIVPRMEMSGVGHVHAFMSANMERGFASIEEAAESVAAYLPHRTRPASAEGLRKNLRQRADGRWYWHWDPRFVDTARRGHSEREALVASLEAAAARITVPTLLVRGSASDIVSPQSVEAFLKLVPHAAFVDVGGAGHMVAGDKNDVFADAVIGFLA